MVYIASIEDIAFRRLPEIGPAADMIYDDLPTNRDYLDESFGAAAGLRAFSDDELDDLDDNSDGETEAKNVLFMEVEPGGIFNFNGETIKVHPEGINIIEEHYDNIPAEQVEAPNGYATNSRQKLLLIGLSVKSRVKSRFAFEEVT
jgi:autophagy-related protein 2